MRDSTSIINLHKIENSELRSQLFGYKSDIFMSHQESDDFLIGQNVVLFSVTVEKSPPGDLSLLRSLFELNYQGKIPLLFKDMELILRNNPDFCHAFEDQSIINVLCKIASDFIYSEATIVLSLLKFISLLLSFSSESNYIVLNSPISSIPFIILNKLESDHPMEGDFNLQINLTQEILKIIGLFFSFGHFVPEEFISTCSAAIFADIYDPLFAQECLSSLFILTKNYITSPTLINNDLLQNEMHMNVLFSFLKSDNDFQREKAIGIFANITAHPDVRPSTSLVHFGILNLLEWIPQDYEEIIHLIANIATKNEDLCQIVLSFIQKSSISFLKLTEAAIHGSYTSKIFLVKLIYCEFSFPTCLLIIDSYPQIISFIIEMISATDACNARLLIKSLISFSEYAIQQNRSDLLSLLIQINFSEINQALDDDVQNELEEELTLLQKLCSNNSIK